MLTILIIQFIFWNECFEHTILSVLLLTKNNDIFYGLPLYFYIFVILDTFFFKAIFITNVGFTFFLVQAILTVILAEYYYN